jgi:hypothetical protein
MYEPSVPEPPSLEDVSHRRTASSSGASPSAPSGKLCRERNCCLFWRSWGRFPCIFFYWTPLC